jgi:hypothetical protein
VAFQHVVAGHLLGENGALQLPQGPERHLPSVATGDDPEVLLDLRLRVAPADLELVSAVRAAHGRAAPANEGVVELVLRLAALALNVHR